MAVTRLIERYGGVVGGLLGTLPTTIVPASIGIWAAGTTTASFRDAMGAVPVGMAVNGLFLYLWRVLPQGLPGGPRSRLAGTTAISLGAWTLLALAATLGLDVLREARVPPLAVGVAAFVALEAGGVWASRAAIPAPRGSRPVAPAVVAARGLLAALAVGLAAVLAGSGDALLAGIASVFPAIFLTTMVSLWWSQGEAVPVGAVGPMILGSGAVGAYALAAALAIPAYGPIVGAALAWVAAAVGVTVPAAWWLRRGVTARSTPLPPPG